MLVRHWKKSSVQNNMFFIFHIDFPLETLEIVSIFYFWGIPRWYHFAVYSSSVGLSWFVNLPRLALLRIELRTLGLPVGCATIALIVDLYTVDSIVPGFLTRLICLVCEHCNLLGLDNSQFTDDRINAARRLKFIIYLWYSFFSLDYSNQPELSWFASWQVVDTPRVWSLG